ncbi:MAG: ACT domain-containing protein [Clostridia bacterium]|nr:ACT domain-containing protein [Clostridia bacterium]
MVKIRQISVFAENKPGKIAKVMKILADSGIDIRAISVADSLDFGILRIICSDVNKALDALKNAGCVAKVNHVTAVSVPDVAGALSSLLCILSEAGVGLSYMYSLYSRKTRDAYMILKTDNSEEIDNLLFRNGYDLVSEHDLDII